MVKVTFTVDEQTVETLKRLASRSRKPQSAVFREAIRYYAEQANRLSNEERGRMLATVDRMMARKPSRSQVEVEAEIQDIRSVRRKGGRRSPAE
jgi:predicted transcriptional regulator